MTAAADDLTPQVRHEVTRAPAIIEFRCFVIGVVHPLVRFVLLQKNFENDQFKFLFRDLAVSATSKLNFVPN